MIALQENQRFTIRFYGTIALLVWGAMLAITGVLGKDAFKQGLALMGFATLVAYLVSKAVDRRAWRWPFLRRLVGIPDFSGRWEGWYWNTLGNDWLPNAHEVTQHGFHLALSSWGEFNQSRSFCAAILTDSTGGSPEIVWSYQTDPVRGKAGRHCGTCRLHLVTHKNGETSLEGWYWTDRPRKDTNIGQGGFIRLAHVKGPLRNALDFQSNGAWGMKKPTDKPS
ncbi:MAG: hypothetical protein NTU53_06315 [Planctomycetota bacterium]|nr:hypothetical protein [Planctomycetota bacterium]